MVAPMQAAPAAAQVSVGRGRGATQPAWMTHGDARALAQPVVSNVRVVSPPHTEQAESRPADWQQAMHGQGEPAVTVIESRYCKHCNSLAKLGSCTDALHVSGKLLAAPHTAVNPATGQVSS